MGIFKSIGKGAFDALIGNPMKQMDEGLTGGMFGKLANNVQKAKEKQEKKKAEQAARNRDDDDDDDDDE